MADDDPRLAAYVDGALDAREAAEIERLIEADPRARAAVEVFRQTAALLRSACGEQLYAAGPLSPPARKAVAHRPAVRRRAALAVAASLVLAVAGFGAGAVWQGQAEADPLGEIAEYHDVFSRETAHMVEVPADQVAGMADWLGEPGGQPLHAPDLGAESLRLAGGRMLVIDGERVAELMYVRDHGPAIGLCVQRDGSAAAPVRVDRRGSQHLASWRDGAHAYVLVGDLDAGATRDLAQRVALQTRS